MEIYDDGTKRYIMKREQKRSRGVVLDPTNEDCNDDIRVFVLFSNKDRSYVNKMQEGLAHKKIVLTKGLAEAAMPYGKKKDIIDKYDYIVVIISKSFLEDLDLLDVLAANYRIKKKNRKILPIIIWEDLYEPENRDKMLKNLEKRVNDYKKSHREIILDLDGNAAKELKRMQRVLKMLQSFIYFAAERDINADLFGSDKLLKYILFEKGIEVADKENIAEDKGVVRNQIINVNDGGHLSIAMDKATINATTNMDK